MGRPREVLSMKPIVCLSSTPSQTRRGLSLIRESWPQNLGSVMFNGVQDLSVSFHGYDF